MPLVINGKIESSRFRSFEDFARKHPHFKESAENFLKKSLRKVERQHRTVYVIQREYATVAHDDENVTVLGSDDATTCHIVVLRNTGSGVASLGHFDGNSTDEGIKGMIASVSRLSTSQSGNGRTELHLFGGFLDDRGISSRLTMSILGFNDAVEGSLHKPIIYGIGITIQDGEIYPATFVDKGPDEVIRHARIFGGINGMVETYNSTYKELRIMPYDYENTMPIKYMKLFCNATDKVILENLSTSPHCEPPDFASTTRATLLHILTHPKPLITVFPEGKPRVYKLCDGAENWTRTS